METTKNIYIQNIAEIRKIESEEHCDIGVACDIYDHRHCLEHDSKARAELKKYCGLPLSKHDQEALRDGNK